MLNILWPLFIILSFTYAIFTGNVDSVNNAIFDSASDAVELSLTFLGTICLWNGIMNIAKKTSLIQKLTKLLNPLMKFLFPDIPSEDPVHQEISMNLIANLLGLGNAATPLGLKAMKSMQKQNSTKDTLSNSMAMFIILNTASLQIIPTTVIAIRSSLGSSNPTRYNCTDLGRHHYSRYFRCIFCKNFNEKILRGGINMSVFNYLSSTAVPLTILLIIVYGLIEKNKVFDTFLEGAREGIEIVFKIFPTLIGIFLAVGALRSSGILDLLIQFLTPILNLFHIPSQIMPLALLRPISGSASMAVATDIMTSYGVDSKIGYIASTIMGSTETTFYTIAIYTSVVGIKKIRFVLVAALIADFIGILTSIILYNISM